MSNVNTKRIRLFKLLIIVVTVGIVLFILSLIFGNDNPKAQLENDRLTAKSTKMGASMKNIMAIVLILFAAGQISNAQPERNTHYLYAIRDAVTDRCGYINACGDTIIPAGKYFHCFADSFRNYGIVISDSKGMVAIDKYDSILCHPFIFDNGPDDICDGMFRIEENGKVGYADAVTGKVVIKPQFPCGLPFQHGKAQVSMDCRIEKFDEEHWSWKSDDWYWINKKGKSTRAPIKIRQKTYGHVKWQKSYTNYGR